MESEENINAEHTTYFGVVEDHSNEVPQDDATGRLSSWEEDGFTVIRANARTAPGCHNNCGVLVYVKDGKVDHIEGDPENPHNQGRLCLRCLALPEMIYHPDRITHPMKRARADRGEDKWERISWDEAWDIIYEEMNKVIDKYGAQSILVTQGTGRDINGYLPLAAYYLGTPNQGMGFLSGEACYAPRFASTSMKIGDFFVCDYSQFFPDRFDDPRWQPPGYILIWGNNPLVANSDGMLGYWVVECMKRGSKLITVDPKLTWLAGKSEYWFQLRPGTDLALLLGMCNVIVEEELYDAEFCERWTYGFEEFCEHVKQYTPEWAAEVCGVDAEKIKDAARAIAKAPSACMQWGVAVDHATSGYITGMACFDLMALTGNFEKPGSMVSARPCFGVGETWMPGDGLFEKIPQPEWTVGPEKRMNQDYPVLQVGGMKSSDMALKALETGEPYPIKAWWSQTNNAVTNMGAEPQRLIPALKSTDFNVYVDLFMTPTAMAVADIFLPACTYVERAGISGHQPYQIGAIKKAIEPLGESKSDMQIIYELGRRFMGEEGSWWKDPEEFFDYVLRHTPYTYDELKERTWAYPQFEYHKHETGKLRPDKEPGFSSQYGRYNFYCIPMANLGFEAFSTYEEPEESPVSTPELAKEYPLILTTGARRWGLFHSEHRQSPSMRQIHKEPLVMIHPETAAEYGIKDGDMVKIENRYGSCIQKAELSTRLRKGVVSADHGWWFPERKDEELFGMMDVNINKLLPMKPGKTGLGNSYKSQLCRVSKA
ncbi:molybdopterin-dependent oxidoreductase [Adlercreutzia sp. ZJ154]|uniref:molybdopterin-containing oxidoreductase family protein n=1 Tax=Adlercreutzia sp. ZJ154 TaxID=2709790 RepID=UPI0013EB1631|nr:molybdopterin-dependent oxidoreductase [Adlercreutzia sp. ZJ154]